MKRNWPILVVVMLSLALLPAAARAQGRCTMQTLAGTYAFHGGGTSTVALAPAPSPFLFHWSAVTAPVDIVGQFTLKPDGTAEGFYWLLLGSLNSWTLLGLDPIPWHAIVTDLKPDCTGVVEYPVAIPGLPPSTIVERFFVMDNGRQWLSVTAETGVPTDVWHTEVHRLTNALRPPGWCGPQAFQGVYLARCRGLESPSDTLPFFSGASIFRNTMLRDGTYEGMVYTKTGPSYMELPVYGAHAVGADCTLTMTLRLPAMPGLENVGRGVVFNEGKEAFFLPLVTHYEGAPDVPVQSQFCHIVRVDR